MDRPTVDVIRERHDRLLDRLRAITADSGHDPERLRIVAITKAHPIEIAEAARDAGLTMLGESRVQEAEPKIGAFPAIEWHFIGRLQSNKARRVMRSFDAIHSVDSVELLQRLDRLGTEEDRRRRVLLQVNVSGEPSKAGLPPEALAGMAAPVNLDLVGLMTIAPMGASDAEARAIFGRLRGLRDRLQETAGIALPELSMGMSADAEAAAAEGATLIRIGTALFGPRR
jgi:pyridoxal phosphate enzyme (YggS family)